MNNKQIDEHTGRTIRQLTNEPHGARLDYFRLPRFLPNGQVMAFDVGDDRSILFVDPETGHVDRRRLPIVRRLKLRESDGRLWYVGEPDRTIWMVDLPSGEPQLIAEVPEDVPGHFIDITCDGRTLILGQTKEDVPNNPKMHLGTDAEALWAYLERPRSAWLWSYDLQTGRLLTLDESHEYGFGHHDTSPTDPVLVKYSLDAHDALYQRIWLARVDGSEVRKIRPQEKYEFVTHEFWWPDGKYIGYTYQDRRNDSTLRRIPWAEYAPVPTHFGVARLDGEECYLSDPLNHYHSHLFISRDSNWAIGDGTDGHSFVYIAPFSFDNTKVDFVPLATIHTPYVPFAGQAVDACVTPDSRWVLYNDTVDGKKQVCAVALDL